jgi:hypothetical protein
MVMHATGHHTPTHWQDALTEFTELGLPEATAVQAELAALSCACVGAAS